MESSDIIPDNVCLDVGMYKLFKHLFRIEFFCKNKNYSLNADVITK